MQAMLNPVVCAAFHPCWRAVPRGKSWRIALRSSNRLAACRGDKLQHYAVRHGITHHADRFPQKVGLQPQSHLAQLLQQCHTHLIGHRCLPRVELLNHEEAPMTIRCQSAFTPRNQTLSD